MDNRRNVDYRLSQQKLMSPKAREPSAFL
jgi:hypothetical protein